MMNMGISSRPARRDLDQCDVLDPLRADIQIAQGHPMLLHPSSAANATFFAQVTRSKPGPFDIPETRPNNRALRHALRTESPAIFARIAPLLEYAREMFDVARAVITVLRKDTLELYDGNQDPIVVKAADSLCRTTITQAGGAMVIPDLSLDSRFSQSPARHQVIGSGRLDFYAGTVLDLGADTDVPNAAEAAVVNEGYGEAPDAYEPLIALLCIFDDKPRHDFDDAALRRLVQLNQMLTSQLVKTTTDHVIMRRLKLQQANLRYLQGRSRRPTLIRAEEVDPVTASATTHGSPMQPLQSALIQPYSEELAEEKLIYGDIIQNITEAIDAASVCLMDARGFKVTAKPSVDVRPCLLDPLVSPADDPSKPWLSDVLTGYLRVGLSGDIQVTHPGRTLGFPSRPDVLAYGSSAGTPYRFLRDQATNQHDAIARAMQSLLNNGQRWWSSANMEDSYLVKHLDHSPESSRHVLLVPAWGSQGSPAFLLAIAFDTLPIDKVDIETFAKSVMIGVVDRLSLRRAHALEKEDESFLAVQPHELRTPLHQLRHATEALRQNLGAKIGSHDTMVETLISEVENAAGQLDRNVNNILTYISNKTLRRASAEATRRSIDCGGGESVEEILASIIPDALALDRSQRSERVEIETIVEFERPSLRHYRPIKQSSALASVLSSLIVNGLRSIRGPEPGFLRIVVTDETRLLARTSSAQLVQPLEPNTNVAFVIEDSGVGMSPEFLATGYFQPMQKQDEFASGSGLSIHLAQKRLDNMHGLMAVESKLGWGTTVHVEVPMIRLNAIPTPLRLDPALRRRSFHLLGFKRLDRPSGKQTDQIVGDYLEEIGLEAAGRDEADILIIREDENETIDHVTLSGFSGSDIWIVSSNAELHKDYTPYRHKVLRHLPLPVMLSSVAKWLVDGGDSVGDVPSIPTANQAEGSSPDGHLSSAAKDAMRPAQRPWVLVVDDNIINRKILVRNMATMSLETCQAKDGLEAFEMFKARRDPVIVLMDINMPVLNGFEASARIRELERFEGRLPCTIIAVTALSKAEDRKRGIEERVARDRVRLCRSLTKHFQQVRDGLVAHQTCGTGYADR